MSCFNILNDKKNGCNSEYNYCIVVGIRLIFVVEYRLCCIINDYPSLKVSNYKLKTYNVPVTVSFKSFNIN